MQFVTSNKKNIFVHFICRFTTSFKKFSEKKQLLWYKSYAYGLPFLLTIVIVVVDNIESISPDMRPNIGSNSCFLSKKFLEIYFNWKYNQQLFVQFCWLLDPWFSQLLYFYAPAGIIIILNVILFILTALNFHRVHQAAQLISSNENSSIHITLSQKKEM